MTVRQHHNHWGPSLFLYFCPIFVTSSLNPQCHLMVQGGCWCCCSHIQVVVFKSEEKQEVIKGIPPSQLSHLQAVFQDAPLKISVSFGSAASNEPELNNMAKFSCKGDRGM